MKRFFILLISISVFFSSCTFISNVPGKSFEDRSYEKNIKFDKKLYLKTDFVTVIPKGQTAVIPDNDICTNIGEVFLEQRTITLNNYIIGKYEVTQELYTAIMGKVPYENKDTLCIGEKQKYRPATGMSWYDAVYFCNELSKKCGYDCVYTIDKIRLAKKNTPEEYIYSANVSWDISKNGFRLPTEAEWEFAARGAGLSEEAWNNKYSGGDISKPVAWSSLNSSGKNDYDETLRSHEVGLKKPNILGIYDMSGNACEWCFDWYRTVTEVNDFDHGNSVYDSGPRTDPIMTKGNYDNHVVRGGAYCQNNGMCTVGQRYFMNANGSVGYDMGQVYQGIRLVRRP